jgi:hypothetical protein
MKLITNNSASDIEKERQRRERERYRDAIDAAYRQMAANLLRVLRGAGRPQMIVESAQAFVEVCEEAKKAGHIPDEIDWHSRSPVRDRPTEKYDAIDTMIRGVLQIVASELINQQNQANAGYSQLHEGWCSYRDYLDSVQGPHGYTT